MPEIFQYDFMIRSFIAGGVVALVAPFIGSFLVVRRYSLIADTLAHVALLGVAIGVLLEREPVWVAVITTIVAAVFIDRIRSSREIFGESVLAIFLSGSLAVGSILLSLTNAGSINLFSFLFGSLSTVSTADLYAMVPLGAAVVVLLLVLYKRFFLIALDEELAQANGLPVKRLNTLLVIMAAITVSIAMRVVGVLLIGALMVIPVVTAMQFGRSFKHTVLLSMLFSATSIFGGLVVSYYMGIASGGTIVCLALLQFIPSLFVKK